jgi:hypothetical protein
MQAQSEWGAYLYYLHNVERYVQVAWVHCVTIHANVFLAWEFTTMYHRLPGCWLEFNLKVCTVNALSVNILQHLLHFITQAYAMATLFF